MGRRLAALIPSLGVPIVSSPNAADFPAPPKRCLCERGRVSPPAPPLLFFLPICLALPDAAVLAPAFFTTPATSLRMLPPPGNECLAPCAHGKQSCIARPGPPRGCWHCPSASSLRALTLNLYDPCNFKSKDPGQGPGEGKGSASVGGCGATHGAAPLPPRPLLPSPPLHAGSLPLVASHPCVCPHASWASHTLPNAAICFLRTPKPLGRQVFPMFALFNFSSPLTHPHSEPGWPPRLTTHPILR